MSRDFQLWSLVAGPAGLWAGPVSSSWPLAGLGHLAVWPGSVPKGKGAPFGPDLLEIIDFVILFAEYGKYFEDRDPAWERG